MHTFLQPAANIECRVPLAGSAALERQPVADRRTPTWPALSIQAFKNLVPIMEPAPFECP